MNAHIHAHVCIIDCRFAAEAFMKDAINCGFSLGVEFGASEGRKTGILTVPLRQCGRVL